MANPIDKIIVEIQAETKELRRGLDKANKQLGNLNKQTGSATNALKQFGSVVAAIGLAQVASQAIQTIREFEDLEADLIDGVLTIQDLDDKTYVISFHEPTSQIWYSSPLSGAHHFEVKSFNNKTIFKDTRDNNLIFPDYFFYEVKTNL